MGTGAPGCSWPLGVAALKFRGSSQAALHVGSELRAGHCAQPGTVLCKSFVAETEASEVTLRKRPLCGVSGAVRKSLSFLHRSASNLRRKGTFPTLFLAWAERSAFSLTGSGRGRGLGPSPPFRWRPAPCGLAPFGTQVLVLSARVQHFM